LSFLISSEVLHLVSPGIDKRIHVSKKKKEVFPGRP
jgi:hypothetical protein